jgi:hypothetical protein
VDSRKTGEMRDGRACGQFTLNGARFAEPSAGLAAWSLKMALRVVKIYVLQKLIIV